LIEIAGGRNIFADIAEGMVDVDPEAVVERNPDIIIKYIYSLKGAGYNSDDISPLKAAWGEMMNRSELAECSAVKNRRVYVIDYSHLLCGSAYVIGLAYYAKWFYPNFEVLDPQTIQQEFVADFVGLDYDVYEHGVFVYHPEQHPDGG
jgi:iron complex transport system substrate-binding protein